jgi:DinB family protein
MMANRHTRLGSIIETSRYNLTVAFSIGTALPAWGVRLIAEFDADDQKANELVIGLDSKQLNWQPCPGAWSVGQCLEHLCITNELYLPAISNSLVAKSASAVQDITPGWFARWFISTYIEPSPESKHARAPKKIVPGSRVELSVLDRFLRSNQAARELVRRARDYDVNNIRFRNPFIPLLRFTVGTGLEIVSGHERRHLFQAERVKRSSGFPMDGDTH